ncbi:phosphatidylinositol glycan anchor biosynthesis class Q [Brevipalpus obovatus]|uniref:phosphatidylinositol glycan anchor biosynthesis class Q n=1 Tax=Brevipalpus obovatus TaxID=246614 RepID=UPI003D9E8072
MASPEKSRMLAFLTLSCAMQHLFFRYDQMIQCLSVSRHHRLTVKLANTLSNIMFDVILGSTLILLVTMFFNIHEWLDWSLIRMERLAENVEQLITSMIAMPVGLKLNRPLNSALGGFFLYHIHIWKTYMTLIRPFLLLVLDLFLLSGLFGASFQLALVSDLIAIATIHIYCFYGYAARLHAFQLNGLISLWRLFRGKKWNQLKRRVDSFYYGSDQLFVGSVCFTAFLFLAPTILLYYVVFYTLRIIILAIQVMIKTIIASLISLPVYGIFAWLLGLRSVMNCKQYTVLETRNRNVEIVLKFQRISFSFLFHQDQYFGENPFVLNKSLPENFFVSMLTGKLV